MSKEQPQEGADVVVREPSRQDLLEALADLGGYIVRDALLWRDHTFSSHVIKMRLNDGDLWGSVASGLGRRLPWLDKVGPRDEWWPVLGGFARLGADDESVVEFSRTDGWSVPLSMYRLAASGHSGRYVYLIADQSGARVKVGMSSDPVKRLASIQTGNPDTLTLASAVRGGRALEAMIHDHLSDYRLSGEWFDAEVAKESGECPFQLFYCLQRIPGAAVVVVP